MRIVPIVAECTKVLDGTLVKLAPATANAARDVAVKAFAGPAVS